MKKLKLLLVITVFLLVTTTAQAQEIFDAIKNNDIAKVKTLIKKDAGIINIEDKTGNKPLHNAAIQGSVELAEMLLLKGADINAVNVQLQTPLHVAIVNEKTDVAKFLIDKGSDLAKQNSNGSTPLHLSVRNKSTTITELLLAKGANLEARDKGKRTPLNILALLTNNFAIAKLLIEKGVDINSQDQFEMMPLNNAAHGNANELIELLLDNNADFDTTRNHSYFIILNAAGMGSERLFKYVNKKCGDALFNNKSNNNQIMRSALGGGSIPVVKFLQEKNIPIILEPNISGWTPVHYAARGNKGEMLEFLVNMGADINLRTNAGKSAYNIAEENGNKDILNLILKLGGNSEPQKFPVLQGPYLGQTPPGKEMKRFAPGIVTTDHSSFSTSPDGKEMYWGSGSVIMTTRIENGKWIKPEIVSFSGKGSEPYFDDVPFVTPDNKKLFFTSQRQLSSGSANKENIWYVERTSDRWSEPKPVSDEVNAMSLHWQVSVSNTGTLYFAGTRDELQGVYYSRLVNGEYTTPRILSIGNNNISASCPFIAPDESYIMFSKVVSGRPVPYISFKSKNGEWMEPINIEKYLGLSNCIIVSPDGKYIFTQNGWWIDASFIEELKPEE